MSFLWLVSLWCHHSCCERTIGSSCCHCGCKARSGCFARSARVTIKNGEKVAMSKLQIGDWVQAGMWISHTGTNMTTMCCGTLQKHHQFRTKTTISVISDPVKSMGGNFLEFLLWKLYKYPRHLSINFENYNTVWKDCVVGYFTK